MQNASVELAEILDETNHVVLLGRDEGRHAPNRLKATSNDAFTFLTIEFVFEKLTMLDCNWKRALLIKWNSIRFQMM
jgi:hypothetical protein